MKKILDMSRNTSINANKLNAEVVNISPQEGLLILFPSYLFHSVKENNSGEERIVISFNIDLLSV